MMLRGNCSRGIPVPEAHTASCGRVLVGRSRAIPPHWVILLSRRRAGTVKIPSLMSAAASVRPRGVNPFRPAEHGARHHRESQSVDVDMEREGQAGHGEAVAFLRHGGP